MDYPEDLPLSVAELVEFSPIEDIVLHILRSALPDMIVLSRIPPDPPDMFILARRSDPSGYWSGDPRFVDYAQVQVDVFTKDPDGDEKGALISEAVRVAFREAGKSKAKVPGRGSVHRTRMLNEPTSKSDWATAQGPVQYADLPAGTYRYESKYEIAVRRLIRL